MKNCPLCKSILTEYSYIDSFGKKIIVHYYCNSEECKILIFKTNESRFGITEDYLYKLILYIKNKYYLFEVNNLNNRTTIYEFRTSRSKQIYLYTLKTIYTSYDVRSENLEFLYKKLFKEHTSLKAFS